MESSLPTNTFGGLHTIYISIYAYCCRLAILQFATPIFYTNNVTLLNNCCITYFASSCSWHHVSCCRWTGNEKNLFETNQWVILYQKTARCIQAITGADPVCVKRGQGGRGSSVYVTRVPEAITSSATSGQVERGMWSGPADHSVRNTFLMMNKNAFRILARSTYCTWETFLSAKIFFFYCRNGSVFLSRVWQFISYIASGHILFATIWCYLCIVLRIYDVKLWNKYQFNSIENWVIKHVLQLAM